MCVKRCGIVAVATATPQILPRLTKDLGQVTTSYFVMLQTQVRVAVVPAYISQFSSLRTYHLNTLLFFLSASALLFYFITYFNWMILSILRLSFIMFSICEGPMFVTVSSLKSHFCLLCLIARLMPSNQMILLQHVVSRQR